MLNNRELAGVILLGLAFAAAMTIKGVREDLWPTMKAMFPPTLAAIWIGYAAVITGTAILLHRYGLGLPRLHQGRQED